jgi:hypothetical protein
MENDCAFANLEDKYTFKLDIIYKHMDSSWGSFSIKHVQALIQR